MSPEKAAIPVILDNDRQAIETALESIGLTDGSQARLVRIKNTSELSQMQISEALMEDLKTIQIPKIEVTTAPVPIKFNNSGNLCV